LCDLAAIFLDLLPLTMTQNFIVTFKDDASEQKIADVKEQIKENGGQITQEYTLIKGFAASIPDAFLSNLQSLHADVIDAIEPDGKVTTQ